MTDLDEAYAIMAGSTRLLPEPRHLHALHNAHRDFVAQMGRAMQDIEDSVGIRNGCESICL